MKNNSNEIKDYRYLISTRKAAQLGIEGIPMLLYFALENYNKLQPCKLGYAKMAEAFRCGTKNTVATAINKLIDKGLVIKLSDGAYIVKGCQFDEPENQQKLSENQPTSTEKQPTSTDNQTILKERSKENINNIKNTNQTKNSGGEVVFSDDFLYFWDMFAIPNIPDYDFDNRKVSCYEMWQKLPNDWKEKAAEYATYHKPGVNPYFWLRDEKFLRVRVDEKGNVVYGESDAKSDANDEPRWLTKSEVSENIGQGKLVCCRNPKTELFGFLFKEDYPKFNFELAQDKPYR